MIRTIVIPTDTDTHLPIPEDYEGKEIEVICYPFSELINQKVPAKKISDLRQMLTIKEFNNLQKYVKKQGKNGTEILMDSNVVIDYFGNNLRQMLFHLLIIFLLKLI